VTLPNTNVTITVQISNLGTQDVTGVQVEVKLDGTVYENTQVNVGAGDTTQTTFTWISTLGSHVFQITVDPNHLINDTNRASMVATFNINVGPTLTINVPLNITSNNPVWVSINGVKYNVTSGQLQTGVPAGNVTVQIQPDVNVSTGIKQVFTGWSDGNSANPRQIRVTQDVTLHANYVTQYLLTVDSDGGSTTPGGWYLPNTRVYVSATNPSILQANAVRLSFNGWTGDLTGTSPFLEVNMTRPVSVKANWTTQYYVTILTPIGTPTGSGWYNAGQVATVGVNSPIIQNTSGERFLLTGWNSSIAGNRATAQITVHAPVILMATWKAQYELNIQSAYGTPQGAGWYDAGTEVSVNIQPQLNYANSTRRIFTGWTGDYTRQSTSLTVQMNSAKTVTANWTTQYLVTFKIAGLPNSTTLQLKIGNMSYPISGSNSVQVWYAAGSAINPTINQTVTLAYIFVYNLTGWHDSTGSIVQMPTIVKGPGCYTAQYNLSGLKLDYS
jgi:uncharacterized repeat protein (TIGR02543 family)